MNRCPTIPVAPRMPIFCRMSLFEPALLASSPDTDTPARLILGRDDSVSFSYIEMNAKGQAELVRNLKMKRPAGWQACFGADTGSQLLRSIVCKILRCGLP